MADAETTPVTQTREGKIVLSDRDYDLFIEMMTADTEPTALAVQEAAEFRDGRVEGSRYHWRQTLVLTNTERDRFLAAIENPSEPTPAMLAGAQRAMRTAQEGVLDS